MPNNYFQFKNFIIQQEQCAMKVCTDACVFGAFIAREVRDAGAKAVFDIGTGTGLLALMTAQKTVGLIDAIELDEAAFQQAKYNFDHSDWKYRLRIFNENAITFIAEKKYDYIISNPPFFERALRSGNHKKDSAKHDFTLTLEQLLLIIDRNLSPQGSFAVLLPFQRAAFFINMASAAGYYVNKQLLIKHTKDHPFFRAILIFSKHSNGMQSTELSIKNVSGDYTPDFISLMKDYYLNL